MMRALRGSEAGEGGCFSQGILAASASSPPCPLGQASVFRPLA